MPNPNSSNLRHLFVASQQVFRLEPGDTPIDSWMLEFFQRRVDYDRATGRHPVPYWAPGGWGKNFKTGWLEVPSRADFFTDSSVRYLCLVDDAGHGKSIAIQQIQQLRMERDQEHVAILIEFDEIRSSMHRLLDACGNGDSPPILVAAYQKGLKEHPSRDDALQQWLKKCAEDGRMTLLVDALDQVGGSKRRQTGESLRLKYLLGFLRKYPRVKCVISGRPSAIQRQIRQLSGFVKGIGSSWIFAQIGKFRVEEIKAILGEECHKSLSASGVRYFTVPRDIETALRFINRGFEKLHTRMQLYQECVNQSIEQASLRRKKKRPDTAIVDLLSLLAFDMLQQQHFGVEIRGNELIRGYLHGLKSRHKRKLDLAQRDNKQFESDIEYVMELNVAMNPGLLQIAELEGEQRFSLLKFRSRTLQACLAARWLGGSYATRRDLDWLHVEIPVRTENGIPQSIRESAETWLLLSEIWSMRGVDRLAWIRAMAPLYRVTASGSSLNEIRKSRRFGELLYRSIPGMLQFAGRLNVGETADVRKPTFENVDAAIRQLQQEVFQNPCNFDPKQPLPNDFESAAEICLWHFFWQFPAILHGMVPLTRDQQLSKFSGDRAPMEIATELHTGFVNVGTGHHWIGTNKDGCGPAKLVENTTPFQLAITPVTNEQFALYAPHHPLHLYGTYAKYSPKPNHPAVHIDYFEAWSAAAWFHARLPRETEWEQGCRGQTVNAAGVPPAETFFWGNHAAGIHQHTYFKGNSSDVTGPTNAPGHENPLGLCDMLGNVGEWAVPVASPDERQLQMFCGVGEQVLKGGNYAENERVCRSGHRLLQEPSTGGFRTGMRLARDISPDQSPAPTASR